MIETEGTKEPSPLSMAEDDFDSALAAYAKASLDRVEEELGLHYKAKEKGEPMRRAKHHLAEYQVCQGSRHYAASEGEVLDHGDDFEHLRRLTRNCSRRPKSESVWSRPRSCDSRR